MKKSTLLASVFCAFLFASCGNSAKQSEASTDTAANTAITSTEVATQPAENPDVQLIQTALQEILKDDLSKDLIPQEERKFIYGMYDLNGDGNNEYFVAPRGGYFCGSGGCTIYLLSSEGKTITRFTLADFPVSVSTDKVNEWNRIYINSKGEQHPMDFNGKSYPSNPSMVKAEKLPQDKVAATLLDTASEEYTY